MLLNNFSTIDCRRTISTARFWGAPGVGFGYLKPLGTGTVETVGSRVVVVVVIVFVAVVLVSER